MLPDSSIEDIEDLLDRAIWLMEAKKDLLAEHIYEALTCRLSFRQHFLRAVASDLCISREDHALTWQICSSALSSLLDSSKEGTPISESFSTKIQHRLASTVPPRPIMMNNLQDTHDYLQRFFKDAGEAGGIFDCLNGSQVAVRGSLQ